MSDVRDTSSLGATSSSLRGYSRQNKELTEAQAEDRRSIEALEKDLERKRDDYVEARERVLRATKAPSGQRDEIQTLRDQKDDGVTDSMQICKLALQLEELQDQLYYQIEQISTITEENTTLTERNTELKLGLVEAEQRIQTLQGQLTNTSTRYDGLKQLLVKFQRDIHSELSQKEIESTQKPNPPSKVAPVTPIPGPRSRSPTTAQRASEQTPMEILRGELLSSTASLTLEAESPRASGTPSVSRVEPTATARALKMPESTKSALLFAPRIPRLPPNVDHFDWFEEQRALVAKAAGRPPPVPTPRPTFEPPPATTTPEPALD